MKPNIKIERPKRQGHLLLLAQIDIAATCRLWHKHGLVLSWNQYLTRYRRANIVGALATDRLGFDLARKRIKLWDIANHCSTSRQEFAELLGLPEPYLAGLDCGFEYGKPATWCKETVRHLGLVDGVAVRRLLFPDEAQD